MGITQFLKKISGLFIENGNVLFRNDYRSAKSMIDSFPEPSSDMERAFYQYKCTMKRMNVPGRIVMNLGSLIMYLPYYFRFTHNKIPYSLQKYDAVFYKDKVSIDIVPNSVREEYPDILTLGIGVTKEMSLNREDLEFLKGLRRIKPWWFYFHLKVMMKLAMTSYCIRTYHPKALISHFEESFACSLMAEYCERKKIKYIGVMHGERLYTLKTAFFRCTEYYAWDQDYVNLLYSMRCERSQFRIEVPNALLQPEYNGKKDKEYDYTIYLQEESDESIAALQKVCEKMTSHGLRVAVRPHPRFSRRSFEKYFHGVEIQGSQDITLAESFSRTKAVIARFSTVLYQAWYIGIPIVIDDYTLPGQLERLRDLRYVMLDKPHELLSDVIRALDLEKANGDGK